MYPVAESRLRSWSTCARAASSGTGGWRIAACTPSRVTLWMSSRKARVAAARTSPSRPFPPKPANMSRKMCPMRTIVERDRHMLHPRYRSLPTGRTMTKPSSRPFASNSSGKPFTFAKSVRNGDWRTRMVLTIQAYETALAAPRPSINRPYSAIGSRIGKKSDTIQATTTRSWSSPSR
jgi:hypothetical protein